jgi:hypothetical protein
MQPRSPKPSSSSSRQCALGRVWGGVRKSDGGRPTRPRWVLLRDHDPDHPMSGTTCDPMTDWLLISGNLVGAAFTGLHARHAATCIGRCSRRADAGAGRERRLGRERRRRERAAHRRLAGVARMGRASDLVVRRARLSRCCAPLTGTRSPATRSASGCRYVHLGKLQPQRSTNETPSPRLQPRSEVGQVAFSPVMPAMPPSPTVPPRSNKPIRGVRAGTPEASAPPWTPAADVRHVLHEGRLLDRSLQGCRAGTDRCMDRSRCECRSRCKHGCGAE